jgi:hypothetical protein
MKDYYPEINNLFDNIEILDIKENLDKGDGETYELWSVYYKINGLKMQTDILRSDFGTSIVEINDLKRHFKESFDFDITPKNVSKVEFVFSMKIENFLIRKIISRYDDKKEKLFRKFIRVETKNISCTFTTDILVGDEYMELSFEKYDTTLTVKPFISKRYDTERFKEFFFNIVGRYCVKEEISFLYSLLPLKTAFVIDEVLGQIILKEFKRTNKYKMLVMYDPILEKILQY